MGRFGGNQLSLLEQLVNHLGHKAVSHSVIPLPVAEAADLKFLCGTERDGIYNVEVA